ncbi:MAG: Abi family protein [Lachnospiraceae bacterium]|nr:Abi family protein [Lachnospiraceae bacterium]
MANTDYKSTDALMRHLRDNGIAISGSSQKQQLINTGYFHGYKGYRFFVSSSNRLPFTSYNDINATIQYDTKLKSLLYGKMMFIETALKNIALNTIMAEIGSNSIYDMYDKVISSYKNASTNTPNDLKKRYQNNKLNLQGSIQNSIASAYRKDNPKISHFYNNMNYNEVPIWAIFEILTMGDFGYLLSCLTMDMREKISREIGINLSCDTYRELVYKYVYTLKDLRNAIAHNDVVYDTRFRKIDPSKPMKQCLILEVGLPYINFKTIGDYIILICYYLKLLKVSKTELKAFIREFEKITQEYKNSVNSNVSAVTIHPDLTSRMAILKNSI